MNTGYQVTYPTLAELQAMTAQDIFNRAATHLLKQGKKAGGLGSCLYRGPFGTACAVGCLIPEDEYRQGMEGATSTMLIEDRYRAGVELSEALDPFERLLSSLQDIHDERNPADWPQRLAKLAERDGLQMVSLEGVKVIPMGYSS